MGIEPELLEANTNWKVARDHLEKGRVHEAVREYLDIVARNPTTANYWRADQELRVLDLQPLAASPNQRVRIGLLGSSTLDVLCRHVRVDCLRAGLVPEIYQGEYGQHAQVLIDGDSPLYDFGPDIVFLSLRLEDFIPELTEPERSLPHDLAPRIVQAIVHLAEVFAGRSSALLIVHNFLVPPYSVRGLLENKLEGGARWAITDLNHRLDEAFRDSRQVFILDYDHLGSVFGKGRMRDPRKFFLADMEWSDEFVPVLSNAYLGYIKPAKGILRKCIVVDLDETLWGGILGENGFDGIQLDVQHPGSQFRDFQRLLLDFHRRGVILAINSKNNFDEAIAVIRDHPYMVLREKHFAAMKINWADKVTNMREISKEINIGLDSMVFIDNSPVERLFMRQVLPEVLTVELPKDPVFYRSTLERLTDFNVLSLTDEDLRRGELYAVEFARTRLLQQSASVDDFLASLNMTLVIRRVDDFSLPRVAQLTQRTNQFNLTTHRYTEAEVAQLATSPSHAVYTLRVTDTFGDNGLVGVAILRIPEGPVWKIDSFLMSCRVLGRRVETCFLHVLLRLAQERGVRSVTGEFIKTRKNEVARGFYPEHGFVLVGEQEGASRWELGLEGRDFKLPMWVTVDVDPGCNVT